MVNSLYEIRKIAGEENVFVQKRIVDYLKKTNPDNLLISATIKYPQFKDESKKLKMFLQDIVDGDDSIEDTVKSWNEFAS